MTSCRYALHAPHTPRMPGLMTFARATHTQIVAGAQVKYVDERVINFKQLVDIKLPKAKKVKETRSESRLYDVEVTGDDPSTQMVKIHYIGYSSRYDGDH